MTTDFIYQQRLQDRKERELRKALIRRRVRSIHSDNGFELTRSKGFLDGTQDIFDLLADCTRKETITGNGTYEPANQNT